VAYTVHSAVQSLGGAGVAWKGRAYQFGRERARARPDWALELARGRGLVALLLVVAGWRHLPPPDAELLLLVGWTAALLEQVVARGPEHGGRIGADALMSAACVGYLLLSGLLSPQWFVPVLLLVAASLRWGSWRTSVALASALTGGLLVVTATRLDPNLLLTAWSVVVALAASRPLAHAVGPWLQRLRSS
jgi:hypothetical protein